MSDRASNIQSRIRAYLDVPAGSLTRVPETENRSVEDAIRVLQLQIFELADAIADLAKTVK